MKKLYVVGLGAGARENRTLQCQQVLAECDVIAGYTVYVEQVRDEYPDKEYLVTGMMKETERCRMAIEKALEGKTVAMVCSGDSGVYGMAGLIYELAQQYPPLEIEIVSGVTAACSGATLLGAPLIHDFAVISLSDLLTPWEKIEKRLLAAAEADFAICIYNPSSKKRHDYLQKACDLILQYRSADTVCGITRQIGRAEETAEVLTLAELRNRQTDMFTTVFIGNSQTKRLGDKMVTPRGYRCEK